MRGGAALLTSWLALLILVVVGKHSTSYHQAKFLHWFEVRTRSEGNALHNVD